jgi:TonB family protein
MNRFIVLLLLLFLAMASSASLLKTNAQTVEAASEDVRQGIQQYKSGDTPGAIKTLSAAVKKDKNNSAAWHYLGLAQYRQGKLKDARKCFENATRLQPTLLAAQVSLAHIALLNDDRREALKRSQLTLALDAGNADAHYIIGRVQLLEGKPEDALNEARVALQSNPSFKLGNLLKSQALVRLFAQEYLQQVQAAERKLGKEVEKPKHHYLKEAAESLEKVLASQPSPQEVELWNDQLQALKTYERMADGRKFEAEIQPVSEALRPVILYRERPHYRDEARSAGIQGTVILLCIYEADGRINHPLVLQGLSHGLTEEAILAAKKIRFEPARKDGKPVAVIGRIEFNFNLY